MAINWKPVSPIPGYSSFNDQLWLLLKTLEQPIQSKRFNLHFVKGTNGFQQMNGVTNERK